MKKEGIFIEVWVVSYFNAIDGLHYGNLHTNRDKAIENFREISDEAIRFASEEMSDFRVIRDVNTLTIYDAEDGRMVISCEALVHTIQCGIMCM